MWLNQKTYKYISNTLEKFSEYSRGSEKLKSKSAAKDVTWLSPNFWIKTHALKNIATLSSPEALGE